LNKELFTYSGVNASFYIDVINLFNNKNMTRFDGDNDNEIRSNSWAWDGHKWWKTEVTDYMNSLGYSAENQQQDGSFSNVKGNPGDSGDGIDMPAFTPYTFLESRDIFFGFRFAF
jgi:hypothetical protein